MRGRSYIMCAMAAALAIAALPAASAAQDNPLTGEQLSDAGKQVQAFVPKDQFDTLPDAPAWAGRRFSYTVKPTGETDGSRACTGLPSWYFVAGKLSLSARPQFINPFTFTGQFRTQGKQAGRSLSSDLNFYSISCKQSPVELVEATNALGAHFPVRKWTDQAIGIFDTGRFDPKWKIYWTKDVEGAAARELSRNLLVRISGTLHAWPNGRMVVCGTDRSSPTITSPVDRAREICGFNGWPDRVEFLNAATGEVLYAMTRKAASS